MTEKILILRNHENIENIHLYAQTQKYVKYYYFVIEQ